MRILIFRHGDPDYVHNCLTPKGEAEAALLAETIERYGIDDFYVSPLPRARLTLEPSLKKLGKEAAVLPWLREFSHPVKRPDRPDSPIVWDWLPADWTGEERFYDRDAWTEPAVMEEAGIRAFYEEVCRSLDDLLASYGYVRKGHVYEVRKASHKTIALFCHFGLEGVILSHFMGVSPMVLWHTSCAAPSSVTSLYSEERQEGTALFRMNYFGALPHLWETGTEPSFHARFVECYEDEGRH